MSNEPKPMPEPKQEEPTTPSYVELVGIVAQHRLILQGLALTVNRLEGKLYDAEQAIQEILEEVEIYDDEEYEVDEVKLDAKSEED